MKRKRKPARATDWAPILDQIAKATTLAKMRAAARVLVLKVQELEQRLFG